MIGREFTRLLLDRLADMRERTDAYLQELMALELVYERRLFPELAYMFKHALTQDVAYNSLLVQRRQELHRLIGLAIEELYADRLAEQYEVLAYHFARGEEWAKALAYFCQAAGWLLQALPLAQAMGNPPQLLKTHLALGRLHAEVKRPEQARQMYHAAREVIERVKANLRNSELRAGLENSLLIQHVYDLSATA